MMPDRTAVMRRKLVAYRPEVARAKGLPEPDDYLSPHHGPRSE